VPKRVLRKKGGVGYTDYAALARLKKKMDVMLREKPRKLTEAERREKVETDAKWESILENMKRDQPVLNEYKKTIEKYKQGKISKKELSDAYNKMWKKLEERDLVNWKNVMR